MRRGVALAGMAAVFAAMLGRAGLVDWQPVAMVALLVLVWGGVVAGGLALVVGVPAVFVMAVWSVIKGVARQPPVPPSTAAPGHSSMSRKNWSASSS